MQDKPTGKCPSCRRRVKTVPAASVITCDEQYHTYAWQCTNCGAILEKLGTARAGGRVVEGWTVVGRDRITIAPGDLHS